MGNILILSDIHANLSALQAVWEDSRQYSPQKLILLGDVIDYGMRPNQVIRYLEKLEIEVLLNISGNHEMSYLKQEYLQFSSDRGRASLKATTEMLNSNSRNYIVSKMDPKGSGVLVEGSKKILLIHGNIDDEFWGKLDMDVDPQKYKSFDIVISGHSHKSHFFVKSVELRDQAKKSIIFINGGSVGQPRNGINKAQYLIVDEKFNHFNFCSVDYDIAYEQSLYDGTLPSYYCDRLTKGV